MSNTSRPDISALVGSRICHDLISPLGAVGNGLELLSLTGKLAEDAPEMDLITQSVENAHARLRLFRIAFGAVTEGQIVNGPELVSILADSLDGHRVTLHADLPDEIARSDAKLALLLILGLETALPRGGTIRLAAARGRWRLEGAGPRLKAEPRLWHGLTDRAPAPPVSAAEVQFALLPQAAADAGRDLRVALQDDRIEIAF